MSGEELRRLYPVLDRVAYLNAGTFGPLARTTVEALEREGRRDLEHGRHGTAWFERVQARRELLRERLGGLVGAPAEQVALTASTTDGCNVVVAGLALGPGDEIVTTTDEHFGLLGPLAASPARVVVVPPEPDAILAAVGPRTRLLALSEVLWTTGARLPVAELRAASGVPVLVDAAQSVGVVPVGMAGIDFLAFPGQKWLCGPDATGALVVADPERLHVARPGWFAQAAYEPDGTFTPRAGARRFDPNWHPAAAIEGLLAALDAHPDDRFALAAAAAARCREALSREVEVVPGDATLVSFKCDDPAAVVAALADAGVLVRDVPGRGLVRASCGWWTSAADVERLRAAVAESAR